MPAAISAGSLRLAGALADRWLPFLWPVNRFDEGREPLEQGALEAERRDRATVTACVPAASARTRRQRRQSRRDGC